MEQQKVSAGSNILVGAPARPMDETIVKSLSELMAQTAGVIEAHLPQVFIPDTMEEPAQVLIVVIDPAVSVDKVMQNVGGGLSRILPAGIHLDIMPMNPQHELFSPVREAGCQIFGSQQPLQKHSGPTDKPWWKIW